MRIETRVVIDEKDVSDTVLQVSIDRKKGHLHTIAEITLSDKVVDEAHVKDGLEHVAVTMIVDGAESVFRLVIDDLDYRSDNVVRLICKSSSVKLTEPYSGRISMPVDGDSGSVLSALFSMAGVDVDINGYSSVGIGGGYYVDDIPLEDAIIDICSITGAEFWHDGEKVVVSDAQAIDVNAEATYGFTSVDNIEEFSLMRRDDVSEIDEVYINAEPDGSVYSEPSALLDVDRYPHPLSPTRVLYFKDDESGEIYKIKPQAAKARIFFNPLDERVEIDGWSFMKRDGYRAIDRFDDGKDVLNLRGGARSIIGIEDDNGEITSYSFVSGHNVVILDNPPVGTVKISYETDIFETVFPPSETEGSITCTVRIADQIIGYRHEYKAVDYWPRGWKRTLNLVSDWYMDENDAVLASGSMVRLDNNGNETVVGSWSANEFGELDVVFDDYGCFALKTHGYDDLYIQFYANRFSIGLTRVLPA